MGGNFGRDTLVGGAGDEMNGGQGGDNMSGGSVVSFAVVLVTSSTGAKDGAKDKVYIHADSTLYSAPRWLCRLAGRPRHQGSVTSMALRTAS